MPNGHDIVQGTPVPPKPWSCSDRFLWALQVAAIMHADMPIRCGSARPSPT